jgi:hypothetical protein
MTQAWIASDLLVRNIFAWTLFYAFAFGFAVFWIMRA